MIFFQAFQNSGIHFFLFTLLIFAACKADHDPADDRMDGASALPSLASSSPLFVDYERNIYIPSSEDLVRQLKVAFSYNDDSVRVHFRFATDRPSWYHQYLVYESGEWVRYGGGHPGPDPHGLYEDRISMMLDDGSVEGFAQLGGFVTAHPGMRSMSGQASAQDVRDHSYLGGELGRSDVRKFIQESREGEPDEEMWQRVRDESEINRLRDEGVFIDLWQWRAHRSNPLGYTDNGYVLDYRHSSEGSGMFIDNSDPSGIPRYMFNPAVTGRYALEIDSLIGRLYSQDDPYFIYQDNAIPYDPERDWQDGDAIPQRFLREPGGSRGALKANGYWEDGYWNLTITRTLNAPDPHGSKTIADDNSYHVAFAVHADGSGARWHYVSAPYSVGFGTPADIKAVYTDGSLDRAEVEWTEIPVFYPGQIDFSWLVSQEHPGNVFIEEGDMHMLQMHQLERLTHLIVLHELRMLGENPADFGLESHRYAF